MRAIVHITTWERRSLPHCSLFFLFLLHNQRKNPSIDPSYTSSATADGTTRGITIGPYVYVNIHAPPHIDPLFSRGETKRCARHCAFRPSRTFPTRQPKHDALLRNQRIFVCVSSQPVREDFIKVARVLYTRLSLLEGCVRRTNKWQTRTS